jgi:hypothetical protein
LSASSSIIPSHRLIPGTSVGTFPTCNNEAAGSDLLVSFRWNEGPSVP